MTTQERPFAEAPADVDEVGHAGARLEDDRAEPLLGHQPARLLDPRAPLVVGDRRCRAGVGLERGNRGRNRGFRAQAPALAATGARAAVNCSPAASVERAAVEDMKVPAGHAHAGSLTRCETCHSTQRVDRTGEETPQKCNCLSRRGRQRRKPGRWTDGRRCSALLFPSESPSQAPGTSSVRQTLVRSELNEAHRISCCARDGAARRGFRVGRPTRVRTVERHAEHEERRLADVYRRPARQQVLASRSD